MTNSVKNESVPLNINSIIEKFQHVRSISEWQCEPLLIEDYSLQAMAETSPAKWHLAHTTWFFETFLLKPLLKNYQPINEQYEYLFNSYYNGIGAQYPRAQRGLLSRPSVEEVYAYRHHVNDAMLELLANHQLCTNEILNNVILGCHHEQQHQELFFTDLKYSWFKNPMYPVYAHQSKSFLTNKKIHTIPTTSLNINNNQDNWLEINSGLYEIGFDKQQTSLFDNFSFDNESPRHKHYLNEVSISQHLVTNGEYLMFMDDQGYTRSEFWLSDGWTDLQSSQKQHAPLYWLKQDGKWFEYSFQGLQELDLEQPVCHLSAYEADAFARWKDCRLPTEFEWEIFAKLLDDNNKTAQFLESELFHPTAEVENSPAVAGKLWQWTSSAYSPYPGYKAATGAIGEYNGKFMCNQLVLRGGSCVTSKDHYRHAYRNFFYPPDQWQFSGLRLAK